LNDIGKERIVQFRSFGVLWKVRFPNTYEFNSLGEEFCAICQIFFSDIKTFYPNLELKGKIQTTEINLVNSDKPITPKLISTSPTDYVWELYLPKIGKPKPYYHFILAGILSVLRGFKIESDENLTSMFEDLLKNKELGR